MNHLFYSDHCSSTNDEIVTHLLYPNSDFTGIYTFDQTEGRGQYGNSWISSSHENIAYSLAVKTDGVSIDGFLFNYFTAISVRRFLDNMTDCRTEIKWPNDLIIKNKKVAGILIEKMKINGVFYYIIGIGINVLQKNFGEITNAGSLATQTKKQFDLKTSAQNLHQFLCENLLSEKNEANILKEFNRHLFRKNEISVFEINGSRHNGIIKKASKTGELEVELEYGIQSFFHKEIKLLY